VAGHVSFKNKINWLLTGKTNLCLLKMTENIPVIFISLINGYKFCNLTADPVTKAGFSFAGFQKRTGLKVKSIVCKQQRKPAFGSMMPAIGFNN
jgi:hypothetical protein